MIYSYSLGLTWILFCSVLSVVGKSSDGRTVTSSYGNSSENLNLHDKRLTRSALLDRNVRELRELYLTRERKEKEDPMNFLSKLYSSMEESRKFASFKMDDFDDGFLDPPQVQLQFHKKVPNCGSIFNITKIMELVDEDKKQRACCPCSWSRQNYQINYCKVPMNIGKEISNISIQSISSPPSSAKTPKAEPPVKTPNSRKSVEKEKTKTAIVQKQNQAIQRTRQELPGRALPEGRRLIQKPPSVQLKNVNVKHGSELSLSPKHPHKPSLKNSKNVVASAAKSPDMSKPPNHKQFLSNANHDYSKQSTNDRSQTQFKQT